MHFNPLCRQTFKSVYMKIIEDTQQTKLNCGEVDRVTAVTR